MHSWSETRRIWKIRKRGGKWWVQRRGGCAIEHYSYAEAISTVTELERFYRISRQRK